MGYTIIDEPIGITILFVKYLLINLGAYYSFLKLSNQKNEIIQNIIAIIEILAITYYYTIMNVKNKSFDTTILWMIFMTIIFVQASKKPLGVTIIMTLGSLSISYIIFFISTVLNSIPNILFHTQNDLIIMSSLGITYLILFLLFMKNKKLKNGIIFSNSSKND